MNGFDPLIHAPKRLRIMAILRGFDDVTFARLRDRLELEPPDLSKQLRALQEAGYLRTRKTGRGPGSRTWVSLTRAGRRAYDAHVEALRELIDDPA